MWVEFLPRRISLPLSSFYLPTRRRWLGRERMRKRDQERERKKKKERSEIFFSPAVLFFSLTLSFFLSHPFLFSLSLSLFWKEIHEPDCILVSHSLQEGSERESIWEKEWEYLGEKNEEDMGKEDIKNSKEEKREGKNVTVDVLTSLLERLSCFLSLFLSFRIFCWRGKEENQKKWRRQEEKS